MFAFQCLRCGYPAGDWLKRPDDADRLTAWDEHLAREFWDATSKAAQQQYDARRESVSTRWWQVYRCFIDGPRWRELRRLVFERAGHTCEACRLHPAQQVHHTCYPTPREGQDVPTLDQFETQPLWAMRAICYECHARQHPHMVDVA